MDKLKILALVQLAIIVLLLSAMLGTYLLHAKSHGERSSYLSPTAYQSTYVAKDSLYNFEPLRIALQDYLKKNNLDAAVYVENLQNGASFGINEYEGAYPASINKVLLSVLIMHKVETGELKMDSKIPINPANVKSNSAIFSSTNKELLMVSRDDIAAYEKNSALPLRFLVESMLQKSDNNAFRVLSSLVTEEEVIALYDYFSVDPYGSYDYALAGKENTLLGAKALANVWSSLYYSTLLKPKNSEYLLTLLANTTLDFAKLAGLPPDTKIAHKFGVYDDNAAKRVFRSCGIMYSGKNRTLYCIVAWNLERSEAVDVTSRLLRSIYYYVNENKLVNGFGEEIAINYP